MAILRPYLGANVIRYLFKNAGLENRHLKLFQPNFGNVKDELHFSSKLKETKLNIDSDLINSCFSITIEP